jgi:hypothetical protein
VLSVVDIACTSHDRVGPLGIVVYTSDGGEIRLALQRDELRSFDKFQEAVVRQTGIWLHHCSETGRHEDQLKWKKMLERALTCGV